MIRRVLPFAVSFALSSFAVPAAATTWVLDADHTTVGFSVRHMMVTEQKGAFDTFTGTIEVDDKDVTKSVVNVEINVASVNTKSQKRDEHLRGPDFFDAAKFPKMTFKSTKIEKGSDGSLKVTGDLSLHGVTKPVVLNVAPVSDSYKDPWGNTHRGTQATAKISRKDFGLVWNKVIEKGGVAVGEDVTIDLQLEFTPAPTAPAKK